jgi:tRNA A37 threonylcarbamoyladenosine biosynthesis protein TsaE
MRLGSLLRGGDLVALGGDLGSGKQPLFKELQRVGKCRYCNKPNFVLINVYQRPSLAQKPLEEERLYHFDAYRLRALQNRC